MIPATALLLVTLASSVSPSSISAAPAQKTSPSSKSTAAVRGIPEYVKCLPKRTVEERVLNRDSYWISWKTVSHKVPKGSCVVKDEAVLQALRASCRGLIPKATYYGCYILVGTPIPEWGPEWCITNQTMINDVNKRCYENKNKT